jgi:hypothetical protein
MLVRYFRRCQASAHSLTMAVVSPNTMVTIKTELSIILALTAICSPAIAAVLTHESASVGTTGQTTGGAAITVSQFIGTRFEIPAPVEISAVGGHFYTPSDSNGEMFVAIMSLASVSSLPSGHPFDSTDLAQLEYTKVVSVSSSSSLDYVFPVSFALTPGCYGLIFGKGQFGATANGTVAAAEGTENLSPYYMAYTSNNGWYNGGFPNARLTLYAVPEPNRGWMLYGLVMLFMATMRRWSKYLDC